MKFLKPEVDAAYEPTDPEKDVHIHGLGHNGLLSKVSLKTAEALVKSKDANIRAKAAPKAQTGKAITA